jgi:DNA-binding Xre family transcriptional regulator
MVITIREKIFLRMKELGVKSRALCSDLKMREQNFSAFMNGRRSVPFDDLEKICMYLGLTLDKKAGDDIQSEQLF